MIDFFKWLWGLHCTPDPDEDDEKNPCQFL